MALTRDLNVRVKRNVKWVESMLMIPEGKNVGEPLKLLPYQKKLIRDIYGNPYGTREAIISMPRKNGKTTFAAALMLMHLCGPEALRNSQLFSTALSLDQSSILYSLAAKMINMSTELSYYIRLQDTLRTINCADIGTKFVALSGEAKTKMGYSASFAIHDETGQVVAPQSDLISSLETSMGAHDNPLSITISTQARTDDALLSRKLDDALNSKDKTIVVALWSAPMEADPFSAETLKACNPAWGYNLNSKEVLKARDKAMRMPTEEASYRNLHLNQRVDRSTPFLSRTLWKNCGGDAIQDFKGRGKVYAGMDLSTSIDLTAIVFVCRIDGQWHVKPQFWLPATGLSDRSKADRVPYDVWHKQGYLNITPGKTISYEYIANYLWEQVNEMDMGAIGFDRWYYAAMRPWLENVGFPEWAVDPTDEDSIFKPFGQGYASMSPAIRNLETDIIENRLLHNNHPILTMCVANAIVQTDPAGNRKLDKSASGMRIDGLIALIMARAVADKDMVEDVSAGEIWIV